MSGSEVKSMHVLFVGQPPGSDELSRWVDSHTAVKHVDNTERACEALQDEPFDLVISTAVDFRPVHTSHFSVQAAAIIESVTQGVCIVGENGDLVWANPIMLGLPKKVREQVCKSCQETFHWAREAAESGAAQVRGRRFSIPIAQVGHYEVTATPVIDLHNRVTQVAAVVWDATSARRLRGKIDAIDQAGRELVSLDVDQVSGLDAQKRLSLLEQKILRCTRDLLHFDNFEIRVLDHQTNKLNLVLACGMPQDDTELYATSEGNGICGYTAARGRSYICPDTAADPRYRAGLRGSRSSLTVPMHLHDRVVGVANFESAQPAAFSEDDRQFAEIFVRYVALSLHILQLLVTERHATTGRLGHDVMAEITAPLNDILTDAESLVEDYIGHDDLRHRIRKISANAVKIRETIKELTSASPGVLGAGSAGSARRDPLLNGKRVLVADDEEVIRETVRDVLTSYGCVVHEACDGAEAIRMIAKEPFDLVLSDIKMPLKNGYDVFAAAKKANAATPVILATGFGYDPNHAIVRARREGLAAVLFKPFKIDQLLSDVRGALTPSATKAT
jgi:CheY-like chemotaxis protein/GAF domain-containing protein